jgi:hypothetical protein
MIDFDMNTEHAVLTIRPNGPLAADDFHTVASAVDPIIEERGSLNGVLIQADSFPGWDSFAALICHFQFIKGHHKHIHKVAVVSDDAVLAFFPHITAHFVSAEVRHFPAHEYDVAMNWILEKDED